MNANPSPLYSAIRRLTAALEDETRLARVGALAELAAVVSAKAEALAAFREVCESEQDGPIPTGDPGAPLSARDAEAMRRLLAAAEENAVVLEAVNATLDDVATRLRTLVGGLADPGVYTPGGPAARHVPAARIDARA